MIRRLALPAAMVLAAGAAGAQDWTGGYAGGQIGNLSVDTDATPSENDLSYGLHAGYTYQFTNGFVLGGELEYDWTDIDLGAATVDSVGRAKALFGFAAGQTMPYAVLGAARAETSLGDADGWLGGLGVAYQVTPNVALSGEVLYHDFSEIGSTSIGADATSLNLRVSYRF